MFLCSASRLAATSSRALPKLALLLAFNLATRALSKQPDEATCPKVAQGEQHREDLSSLLQLRTLAAPELALAAEPEQPALLEANATLSTYEIGTLHLAPSVLGCYPRSAGDTMDPPSYLDLSCAAPPKKGEPCRSGLPFFRLPMLPAQSFLDCCTFCGSKGLDLCGLASTAQPVGGMECRCGASAQNKAAWQQQNASRPELLLDPGRQLASLADPACAVMVWKFGADLVDGSVPPAMQAVSESDSKYIRMVLGLNTDPTFKPVNVTMKNDLVLDPEAHSQAVSLLAVSGLCQDSANTGIRTVGGRQVACSELKSYCSTVSAKAACPLTCAVCSQQGNWLPCYPNACGPGGGPWTRKATDGNVYINYWFANNIDQTRRDVFRAAADEWEAKTCIRFIENSAPPRILVQSLNANSCSSTVGYPGDGKDASFNMGWCSTMTSKGSIMHELGHALGMNHEQNRPDATLEFRTPNGVVGPFLRMYWNNIAPDWISQYTPDQRSYVGSNQQSAADPVAGYSQYDYGSIMHYPRTPNNPNFDTTNPIFNQVVGQRSALSAGDVRQVMDMYQCTNGRPAPTTTTTTTSQDTWAWFRGSWVPDSWGPCAASTGSTTCTQTRSLNCKDSQGRVAPASSCSSNPPPASQTCSCNGCQDASPTRFSDGTKLLSCQDLIPKCSDAQYGAEVKKDCPAACGVCKTTLCQDMQPTGINLSGGGQATCAQLAGYCDNPTYAELVRRVCPRTCNTCGACSDQNPTGYTFNGGQPAKCPDIAKAGYCTDVNVGKKVRQVCKFSCRACDSNDLDQTALVFPTPPVVEH